MNFFGGFTTSWTRSRNVLMVFIQTSGAKLFSSHAGAPHDKPLLDTTPDLYEIQKAQKPLLPPLGPVSTHLVDRKMLVFDSLADIVSQRLWEPITRLSSSTSSWMCTLISLCPVSCVSKSHLSHCLLMLSRLGFTHATLACRQLMTNIKMWKTVPEKVSPTSFPFKRWPSSRPPRQHDGCTT
jgi:hypothetical protein